MSTRATYEFIDRFDNLTVYKHHDGYPEWALLFIHRGLQYAWPLPRFEASDFSAAFIAANKKEGGGVRCTTGRDAHPDTVYHYVVKAAELGTDLFVEIHTAEYDDNDRRTWRLMDRGLLSDLISKYCKSQKGDGTDG